MSHIRVGAAGLIATLALLAGVPVAGAAPPWSAPASLPGDVPPVYAGGAVASQNGTTLVHQGALLNGKLVWLNATAPSCVWSSCRSCWRPRRSRCPRTASHCCRCAELAALLEERKLLP